MGFQDNLKQQIQQQSGGNERPPADYPALHLKHQDIRFPKGNPSSILVRILPPVENGAMYAVQTREIYLQVRNHNNKDLAINAVLHPFGDANDELDQAITQWRQRKMVPGYSREQKPGMKFLVNATYVVQNPQTGQYEEERDPQTGELVVRLLKLPFSAAQAINEKLTNPMYAPQALQQTNDPAAEYSFISSLAAYPLLIKKPDSSQPGPKSYSVDLMQNMALGPLPQGWENQLEDLTYQATPTIQHSKDYADYFIRVVNGEEQTGGQNNAPQGQPQPNTAAPTQPVGNWSPQQNNGSATGMNGYGGQAPTPPTQPQAPNPADAVNDDTLPTNLTSMPDVPGNESPYPNQGQPVSPQPQEQPQPQAPVKPQPQAQGQGQGQGMPAQGGQREQLAQQQQQQSQSQQTQQQPQEAPSSYPDVDELLKGM